MRKLAFCLLPWLLASLPHTPQPQFLQIPPMC
jgi:hypothetical protein